MGSYLAPRELRFAGDPPERREARLSAYLDRGIHGLCFSAYADGQSPLEGHELSLPQVRDRLSIIAPHCRWIRTFSCTDGNEHAPPIAHELGLKTMVGAWIGADPARDRDELDAVIDLARRGCCDRIAVGNEVLLRGERSVDEIIALMDEVRRAVPGIPVGYVDAYFEFLRHPALLAACDFIPVNCYPFWEQCPLERALPYAGEMLRRVKAKAEGKPVIVAETGWPSAGAAEGEAMPGLDNMVLFALNLLRWARGNRVELFWFAAFDEAWKVSDEGAAGTAWGLWNADGHSKIGCVGARSP